MGLDQWLFKKQHNPPVEQECAYWRKANWLRQWVINHCDNFEDEGDTLITHEQLQELLETCETVCTFHNLAPKLLPTMSGFFFGSLDYDEYYFAEVEYTVELLRKLLADPDTPNYDFYYSEWY